MKLTVQYVNDPNGNPVSVLLSIEEWNRLLARLNKYEQALKVKFDLEEGLEQAAILREARTKQDGFADV